MEKVNKLIPVSTNNVVQKVSTSIGITNKLISENNKQLVIEIFQRNPTIFLGVLSSFLNRNSIEFENFVNKYNNSNYNPKLLYCIDDEEYYFLNEKKEKVLYPLIRSGLHALFSCLQVDRITSRFAYNYFENSNLDFNNIDFNNGEKLPNLSNFIQKQILDKISELEINKNSFKDKIVANTLKKSLNYVDYFTESTNNLFTGMSSININLSNTDKIKLFLKEDIEIVDPILNETIIIPFHKTFSTLLEQSSLKESNTICNRLYWDALSSDETFFWTHENIESYKNKWNWERLSRNNSLPWSIKLIHKYAEKIKYNYCIIDIINPYIKDLTSEDVFKN